MIEEFEYGIRKEAGSWSELGMLRKRVIERPSPTYRVSEDLCDRSSSGERYPSPRS